MTTGRYFVSSKNFQAKWNITISGKDLFHTAGQAVGDMDLSSYQQFKFIISCFNYKSTSKLQFVIC